MAIIKTLDNKINVRKNDTLHISYTDKYGSTQSSVISQFEEDFVLDTVIVDNISKVDLDIYKINAGVKIILATST